MAWRELVAREKVARHAGETYWGRPVPGFGDPDARILVVGLAPAAHGGNRTGRVFTGDRSGDFLWTAMHAVGLANQPIGRSADDGLRLLGAYVAAAVRCAPPLNRPTPEEIATCAPYLVRELEALDTVRVVVALGQVGWEAALRTFAALGHSVRPKPRFAHGAETVVGPWTLLATYHPSQQNTFTGKLTPPMLESVFARAVEVAGGPGAAVARTDARSAAGGLRAAMPIREPRPRSHRAATDDRRRRDRRSHSGDW